MTLDSFPLLLLPSIYERINHKPPQICFKHLFVVLLERAKVNDSSNRFGTNSSSSSHGLLLIPDESTLSRLVAARLDLPISQSLLRRNFKLSIIKQCWEDQLRLKRKIKRCYSLESRVTKAHLF
jgi:hypothetical protein